MKEYNQLKEIQRDRVVRNKLLNEQYSYSELKRLSKQFGFTEIDDPDFIDFMIPPGTTPKGFGEALNELNINLLEYTFQDSKRVKLKNLQKINNLTLLEISIMKCNCNYCHNDFSS